jgi:hypothetical protein
LEFPKICGCFGTVRRFVDEELIPLEGGSLEDAVLKPEIEPG